MKLAAVTAIAASGVVGLGLVTAATAHAGENGQQVEICVFAPGETTPAGDYRSAVLSGNNQNGEYVSNTFALNSGCTQLAGWWWRGFIDVKLTNSAAGHDDIDILLLRV